VCLGNGVCVCVRARAPRLPELIVGYANEFRVKIYIKTYLLAPTSESQGREEIGRDAPWRKSHKKKKKKKKEKRRDGLRSIGG
jgi:hypothetical protein